MFFTSGTLKVGSGMSYLYIGWWSRGRLTYQIAGNCYFCGLFEGSPSVDVIYIASNKEETNPGASGQVQDHQEHHRDDQEQLLDNF